MTEEQFKNFFKRLGSGKTPGLYARTSNDMLYLLGPSTQVDDGFVTTFNEESGDIVAVFAVTSIVSLEFC